MNNRVLFFYLVLCFSMAAGAQAQHRRTVPPGVLAILDGKFPAWKLIQVSPLHEQSRQQMLALAEEQIKAGEATPDEMIGYDKLKGDEFQPTNTVFGDFDGDGMEDCAVAIKWSSPQNISLVLFLAKGDGYQEQILESIPVEPDYTLMLMKKGEKMGSEDVAPETDYIRIDVPKLSTHWFLLKAGKFEKIDFEGG